MPLDREEIEAFRVIAQGNGDQDNAQDVLENAGNPVGSLARLHTQLRDMERIKQELQGQRDEFKEQYTRKLNQILGNDRTWQAHRYTDSPSFAIGFDEKTGLPTLEIAYSVFRKHAQKILEAAPWCAFSNKEMPYERRYTGHRHVDPNGTLLHAAVLEASDRVIGGDKHIDVQMIEFLLSHGANINAQDSRGQTPLMHAVDRLAPDMVKLLLKHGPDRNIKDENNKTVMEHFNAQNVEILPLWNQSTAVRKSGEKPPAQRESRNWSDDHASGALRPHRKNTRRGGGRSRGGDNPEGTDH